MRLPVLELASESDRVEQFVNASRDRVSFGVRQP
jgi:hypothetical protein